MSQRASAPMSIAPLQYAVAEPITDPAEQARLDRLVKRARRKKSVPLGIAPLQIAVVEDITDPAEQTAIDKLRKRLKAKQRAKGKGGHSGPQRRGRKT